MSTHVTGGVLLRKGRVLLGLRAPHKKVAANCWDMAGGHVEPGETPEACLRRELAEELGVDVVQAVSYGSYRDPGHDLIVHVFVVTDWTGEPAIRNDEHVQLRWFRCEEAAALPNLADIAYRPFFLELAGGIGLSADAASRPR